MKRLVLDTNAVVSALLWGGAPRLLLVAAREGRIELFTSTPLLAELTDVLGRPRFERKISASTLSVEQIVDRYAELAALVRPANVPGIAPDPDDDVVIGTALAARADLIVTGDRRLRSLTEYQGVRIMTVAEALQAVGTAGRTAAQARATITIALEEARAPGSPGG